MRPESGPRGPAAPGADPTHAAPLRGGTGAVFPAVKAYLAVRVARGRKMHTLRGAAAALHQGARFRARHNARVRAAGHGGCQMGRMSAAPTVQSPFGMPDRGYVRNVRFRTLPHTR